MGRAFNQNGRQECFQIFTVNLKERDHQKGVGVDGRTMSDVKEIDVNSKYWICLTYDRDYRKTLVNVAWYFGIPKLWDQSKRVLSLDNNIRAKLC